MIDRTTRPTQRSPRPTAAHGVSAIVGTQANLDTPGQIGSEAVRASVIIVNFNGGEALIECLESLARAHDTRDEIILVDNASSDSSVARVEQLFPEVCVIRNAINPGFGDGNNLGALHATGKYLAFLNPDTRVEPGWLSALVAALESDSRAGLTTSRILLMDDQTRVNTCGIDVHYTGLALCRGAGLARGALSETAEVGAISGAAFAIRRDLFESLGGFDGDFFLYMEDTDLSWRVRLAGYSCIYVPQSVVYHHYILRFGPQKIFYQERNRYRMLLKVLHWRTLLALIPALVVAETVTWSYVMLKQPGRALTKLRAYSWIARNRSEIMKQRQRVQSMRRASDRDLLASCTHRLAYEQTSDGPVAKVAHRVLDPVFLVLMRLALVAAR